MGIMGRMSDFVGIYVDFVGLSLIFNGLLFQPILCWGLKGSITCTTLRPRGEKAESSIVCKPEYRSRGLIKTKISNTFTNLTIKIKRYYAARGNTKCTVNT